MKELSSEYQPKSNFLMPIDVKAPAHEYLLYLNSKQ